jgi:hypothetical protein
MSRSSGGTYTLPANTAAVSGQTASSSKYNTLNTDVASALTDSLDRTGKGAMQAQFKGIDGVAATPGIAFSAQPSTGMRRIDADSASLVQNGVDSLIFTDTEVEVPNGSAGASNLVVNGDFGSLSSWVGANWALAAGAVQHTVGATTSLTQAVAFTAALKYRINYTVIGRTAGTVTAELQGGATVSGTARSTNDTFEQVLTAVSGNTAIAFTPSTDFDGSLDNVTLFVAAVPGMAFQADPDSGFRSVAAGQVGMVASNIDIGSVTTTGINLAANKTYKINGTPLGAGTQTVNLLAAGMVARLSGGTPTASTAQSGLTNPKTLAGYSFAAGAGQGLQIAFPMPASWDAGTLTFSFWYYVPTSTVGDIKWETRAVSLSDGDDFDATAWGAFVTVIDSTTATNLVTNGNFASFTGWSGTNWSQVSNAAKHATGATNSLVETISLTTGVSYTVIFDVTGRTAGTVKAELQGGSTVSGTSRSSNSTAFQDTLVAVAGNNKIAFTPSTDFDGSIDNVFVYAASTAILKTGAMTVTPGGTPAASDMLMVEVARAGNAGTDTLTQAAILIAVQMTYTTTEATDG